MRSTETVSTAAGAPPPHEPSEASGGRPGGWKSTFVSLQQRDFAWFFAGNVAFFMAQQMNLLLRGYVALEITDSASALGLIVVASALPMTVVAPVGGVVSDYVNKRTLLIVTQASVALVMVVVSVLIITDAIRLWHLAAAAVGTGSVIAIVMPARQSVVPQLVPQHNMSNAVSLQMGGQNLSRVIGPGIAAGLIPVFGAGGAYISTVVLYGLGALSMFMVPSAGLQTRTAPDTKRDFRGDLTDGVRYVWGNPLMRMLLLTALALPLFGFPVQQILPVFAEDVFNSPEIALGILATATGVGGLAGTLLATYLDAVQWKGRMMLTGALVMALGFIAFALMPILWIAVVFITIGSVGRMLFMTTNNAVIQTLVPDEYRGRVMSLLMMSFGVMPLGVLPVAIAADFIGAPASVAISSSVLLGLVIVVFAVTPVFRNLKVSPLATAELSPVQAAVMVERGEITQAEADRMTGRAEA